MEHHPYAVRMRATIHASACVETRQIGRDVTVGPGSHIGPSVTLGDGVIVGPNAVLTGDVHLEQGAIVEACAVVGKAPLDLPWLKHRPHFEPVVHIGPGAAVGANAVVYQGVALGRESLIGDGASVREDAVIGDDCAIGRLVTFQPGVRIGARSRIYDHSHLTVGCVVGEDVFVGVHVTTTADDNFARGDFDPVRVSGPRICDRAAIGAGAVLLRNIVIGEDAVVGAGAVVTKSVPPKARVLGVPAREVP